MRVRLASEEPGSLFSGCETSTAKDFPLAMGSLPAPTAEIHAIQTPPFAVWMFCETVIRPAQTNYPMGLRASMQRGEDPLQEIFLLVTTNGTKVEKRLVIANPRQDGGRSPAQAR